MSYAARDRGYGHSRINHATMVPKREGQFMVIITALVGQAILAEERKVHILGLGVAGDVPAWG